MYIYSTIRTVKDVSVTLLRGGCLLLSMLLDAFDDGINVLPYLSIAARLDDGLVEDAVGLVHLHHTVVVDA